MVYFSIDNVFYYRAISKSEIDFIVEYDGMPLPIEIKFRNKPTISSKIYRSFKENNIAAKARIFLYKRTFEWKFLSM